MDPGERGEVLVADDMTLELDASERILIEAGFNVVRAQGGVQALIAARARVFDTILLDVEMADLGGYQVCRLLKADPRTRTIPVIFLTGRAGNDENVIRGLDLGGSDYITRPINPRILVQRIHIAVNACRAEAVQRRLADERAEALNALSASHTQAIEARRLSGLMTMAQGLAHEINNPLAAALANLDFVRSAEALDEEQRTALLETTDSLHRIASIVDRMRWLGDGIKQELARPLDELVSAAVMPATVVLASRGIQVEFQLESTPPVPGASRLAPVMTELVTNAANAVKAGGRIVISTALEGERAVLKIIDDGCGMDEAACARVFEPFFTSKREWRSIGLGLPMCFAIVTSLAGTIDVESSPGKGTSVVVRVPVETSSG